MLSRRHLLGAGSLLAALSVPLFVNGCDGGPDALCCNEFKAGGTIDAKISGSAQGQVLAQATADFTATAAAVVDDVTTACRNIAQDLDAPANDQTAAESKSVPREKMAAWCDLAVRMVTNVKAGATITATFQAPKCEASVSAKANCQAKCDVSGKCDIKANPPKCEGGKLEVSCSGKCTAEGSASVKCTGGCSAECKGECTATGGVECSGTCSGSCEATGGVQCDGECQGTCEGTQSGGKCQGTCKGTCKVTAPGAACQGKCTGTCSVTPPGVKCTGTCKGECTGSCEAQANAKVQCDGKCEGEFEPIKCTGGELKGGCQVDAKCDANCDASVKAKAECTPPEVKIAISGSTNAEKIIATLEANLPLIFGVQARAKAIANVGGTISGNLSAVGDIKAACIPLMVGSAADAAQDVATTTQATAAVAGTVSTN
jgi:orotate phosphoribosyltransferase-like protein